MQRTNIYLDPTQLEILDRLAAEQGASRAELIRRLVDQGLAGTSPDATTDVAAILDSFGVLGDTPVPQRSSDERQLHLESMWRQSA